MIMSGGGLLRLFQALFDGERGLDRVSVLLQEQPLSLEEIRVVVNDKYASQSLPP